MDVREKLVKLLCEAQHIVTNTNKADYLLANGVTVQEWIPVTERLTKKQGKFICTYKFNSNSEMQFVGVLEYYASSQYPHWQHESAGVIVTHWMPIPEPQKGE